MMIKTKNEKSSISGTNRERLSPAESRLEGWIYEVHSGVDLVNWSSQVRIAHVTCFE